MVTIGMAGCSLGVEGSKVVAEMVSVMASLTRVDVRYNALGMQDKDVLRKAVEGRSGFDLLL